MIEPTTPLQHGGPIPANMLATRHENRDDGGTPGSLQSMKVAALTLLRELEFLERSQLSARIGGLSFHEEVRRYEIGLIKCALRQTGGNQVRAAKLLKMNISTLNSKIKRLRIPVLEEDDLVHNEAG